MSLPEGHPAATVGLIGGWVQMDILAPDGRSRTLTIPMPNAAIEIPAVTDAWFPSPNAKSPLVWQGSAVPVFGGRVTDLFFSAIGKPQPANGSGAGTPAGPGLFTDTGDPVNVRFHADGGGNGAGGSWSPTVTVAIE